MNRKEFIYNIGVASTGLIINPNWFNFYKNTDAKFAGPVIWPILANFARHVGYSVLVGTVAEYVKDYLDENVFQKTVTKRLQEYKKEGFVSKSSSKVYSNYGGSNPQQYRTNLSNDKPFHSLGNDREVIVPFYNFAQKKQVRLLYPSILCLEQSVEQFTNDKGLERRDASNFILPQYSLQLSKGTVEKGYMQPDIYKTERGKVQLDYGVTKPGQGEGRIMIFENNTKIFDYSYPILFD